VSLNARATPEGHSPCTGSRGFGMPCRPGA
jgi:hypothetical protein